MNNNPEQLRADVMYLARRLKALEDAFWLQQDKNAELIDALSKWNKDISQWSEFLTVELLKQGVIISKHKRSYGFFQRSLSETHKRTFEELESISLKIKQLFAKVGHTSKDPYTIK